LLVGLLLALSCVAGGAQEGARPAGGEASAGYAPGKVIVKFEADSVAANALRAGRIRQAPLHELALSPGLDALKEKYDVATISSVFRAFDVKDAAGNVVGVETMQEHAMRVAMRLGRPAPSEREMAELPDLTSVYSLKIADDADVPEAVAGFSACAGVEYAQPAYLARICGPPDPPDDPYWLSSDSWGRDTRTCGD